MRIYTSYFANIQNLEAAGIYPLGICNKTPQFFQNPNLESVAPSDSILYEYKNSQKTDADRERYEERYVREILCAFRFRPELLIERIAFISEKNGGADVALCCYERPEDFCHRHILAKWLNERLSLGITEYPVYPEKALLKKKNEGPEPETYNLF